MRLLRRQHIPLLATVGMLIVLFSVASALYPGFASLRVVANLFSDNAFLGIVAVGMTFVILSGGIDLSVGAVLAFTTILIASLVGAGWHPLLAISVALVLGSGFGAAMGWLIHRFILPPFLVTLAGMFFARGMAFLVQAQSAVVSHPFYDALGDLRLQIGPKAYLPITALLFLLVVLVGIVIARRSRFGRAVYAIGGAEASALMMGLPVGRTKVRVYALSGFCASLGGVAATLYMGSGNPAMGSGLELDAIAAVVIGGTLLTGGVGSVFGTLAGVLIFGTIQSALVFDGRLNSWWLRIVIASLLLAFILLQKALTRSASAHP